MLINCNYVLLDGARLESRIEEAKELIQDNQSLYKGRSEEEISAVGPYLFKYVPNSIFSRFVGTCWGNACCVLMSCKLPFAEVYKHFQKFLVVMVEDQEEVYFRFYDPRVLRIFLPGCNNQEIIEFFGPIEFFIIEGETKEIAILFSHKNGELKQEVITASKVFPEPEEKKTPLKEEAHAPVPENSRSPRRFFY